MTLGCKRIHKPRPTLSGFLRIFMEFCGSKFPLAPPYRILSIASLATKSSLCCYFFKYFVLTDFFWKKAYFKRKFIKYLMELTWVGSNHLKVFWKWMLWLVSVLGIDTLPIWILFALNLYCYILSTGYLQPEVLEESIKIFICQKKPRPTLNKHSTSIPLKLFN